MAEDFGKLMDDDEMKTSKFETVNDNSDDEIINFEDENWKPTTGERPNKLDFNDNRNCREQEQEQLWPINYTSWNVGAEDCVCQYGKSDSHVELFHPNQAKQLGRQKDMELMQKDIRNMLVVEIQNAIREFLCGHSSHKRHIDNISLKPSNILLNGTTKSIFVKTPNDSIAKVSAMDSVDFTALDISSVPMQSWKIDVEMKMTQPELGALRAKDEAGKTDMQMKMIRPELGAWRAEDEAEKTFRWWPLMKTENEYFHSYGLEVLFLSTLLSIMTFYFALKIRGCLKVSYKNNSSLKPICQIFNQYPDIVQLVLAFNTLAFFFSVVQMLIIFNKLPLRPLLLVSSFSMLGAYICIISGPPKLPFSSF